MKLNHLPGKSLRLARICGSLFVCLVLPLLPAQAAKRRAAAREPAKSAQHYQLSLEVDYRLKRFTGREVVRFVNNTRDELDSVSFHLYPNVGLSEDAAPWLTIKRVLIDAREQRFQLRSRGTVARVPLPVKLPPGASLALTLEFTGRIPKVQREETSLLAHFLQEVNDAVSDERQQRDARDIFFASDQAVLLGYFYPMLATRDLLPSEQGLAAGVGGIVFSAVADYEVTVRVDDGVTVISSGESRARRLLASAENDVPQAEYVFRGERLRGFALVLGEKLKSVEQQVGRTRVVSFFHEGDERPGQRSLEIAARSLAAFNKAFGEYPYPVLNVVEIPMTAGYSGMEFPGLVALAQAYYIDFAAPEAQRLPQLLRDQADVIENALEFTLAHSIAHQWWGSIVGSDPQRNPWLDEALANYAAAYYYEATGGKLLGEEAIDRQLRATYHAYCMLGGADQEVDKPARDFHSFIQYSAIVQAKGALMLVALRREMGDEAFFTALRDYYAGSRFRVASPEDLRQALLAAAASPQVVKDLMQRWLKEKHADEDIGKPELALFTSGGSKKRAIGRFFGRIGRAAARPF
ncbi:MAG TPA: M1 family metallopeptidase [Blastocatellia bacterium]|nr:M1 family metallopeptidase [Blastocatellia bacterium]